MSSPWREFLLLAALKWQLPEHPITKSTSKRRRFRFQWNARLEARFNIRLDFGVVAFSIYRKMTVSWQSLLYNGNAHAFIMVSLYWHVQRACKKITFWNISWVVITDPCSYLAQMRGYRHKNSKAVHSTALLDVFFLSETEQTNKLKTSFLHKVSNRKKKFFLSMWQSLHSWEVRPSTAWKIRDS